jgi:hypothetical protein
MLDYPKFDLQLIVNNIELKLSSLKKEDINDYYFMGLFDSCLMLKGGFKRATGMILSGGDASLEILSKYLELPIYEKMLGSSPRRLLFIENPIEICDKFIALNSPLARFYALFKERLLFIDDTKKLGLKEERKEYSEKRKLILRDLENLYLNPPSIDAISMTEDQLCQYFSGFFDSTILFFNSRNKTNAFKLNVCFSGFSKIFKTILFKNKNSHFLSKRRFYVNAEVENQYFHYSKYSFVLKEYFSYCISLSRTRRLKASEGLTESLIAIKDALLNTKSKGFTVHSYDLLREEREKLDKEAAANREKLEKERGLLQEEKLLLRKQKKEKIELEAKIKTDKTKRFRCIKEENKELIKTGVLKCPQCDQIKVVSLFYKKSSSETGYAQNCKECSRVGTKDYYSRNREIIIEKTKRHQKENKEHHKQYRKEYKKRPKQRIRSTIKSRIKEYLGCRKRSN